MLDWESMHLRFVKRVMLDYVIWWLCALVKFSECCEYGEWWTCICFLIIARILEVYCWCNDSMLCDLIKRYLLNIERWICRYAFIWLYVYYAQYNLILVVIWLTVCLFVWMGRRRAWLILLLLVSFLRASFGATSFSYARGLV